MTPLSFLKKKNISLDIYGDGSQKQMLLEQINQHGLSVQLKGKAHDIPAIMKQYDGFVMTSSFEGFGIVVAEAMAAGLPLILSGIPVLREVTEGRAFFIDLQKPASFAVLAEAFLNGEKDITIHAKANQQTAKEKYTQGVYLQRLLKIYEDAIRIK